MAKKAKGIGLANTVTVGMPHVTAADRAREMRYRAESDLRTLQEAEQIRADRGRHTMAQRVGREQMQALAKVTKRKSR